MLSHMLELNRLVMIQVANLEIENVLWTGLNGRIIDCMQPGE